MQPSRVRVDIQPRYQRDLLVEAARLWPRLGIRLETAGLALLVCAFWALVLFAALTTAL